MKRKWLKGTATLLTAALLVSVPGISAEADYQLGNEAVVTTTETAMETVMSVSGGDEEALYPAPTIEWVNTWELKLTLPEELQGTEESYEFQTEIYKDGIYNAIWTTYNDNGVSVVPVYYDLTDSGVYSYVSYVSQNGVQISEKATIGRAYTAPAEKLGTTVAEWHDGGIPRISFQAIPHTAYYLVDYNGGGTYWPAASFDAHEDGTLWATDVQMKGILSQGAGEYKIKIQAISEDVTLYANGDWGAVSETFSFDGNFQESMVSNDIEEIKTGLQDESVKEIEYVLNDGAEISEADQAEIFSAIKGTDKSFTFTFQNEEQDLEYQWIFEGAEITDDTKAVNFQIIVDANVQEVIDCVDTNSVKEVDLAFLYEGALPGKAMVNVNLQGKLGDAKTAHLYYFNPETKRLEAVAENLEVVDGYVAFPLTHCSNYILTAEMLKDLIPDKEDPEPTPQPTPQPTARPTTQPATEPTAQPTSQPTAQPTAGGSQTASVQSEEPAAVQQAAMVTYIVEVGDSLQKIAVKFYGDGSYWKKIYEDNAGIIRNPNLIYAGQALNIYLPAESAESSVDAAGEIYTVQSGDSLWSIAKKYYGKGQLCSKIYQANQDVIANPKRIRIGQKLVIPE